MKSGDGAPLVDNDNVRVYPVVTRFQRAALRPGGVSRDQAIADANAGLERLKPEFDEWISNEVEALRRLLPWLNDTAPDAAWNTAAAVHCDRLRDVGTTAGYELVSFVAGSMCEILESDEATTPRGIESLKCQFDALQLVRKPEYYRLHPKDLPELKDGLQRMLARIRPDTPSEG